MTLRIFLAVPALALAAPALAQDLPYRMVGWHGGWGMMFFGPAFMLLSIAGIVALVVWLLRGSGQAPPSSGRTPVDILKERFARGEIDAKEFEERRKILER